MKSLVKIAIFSLPLFFAAPTFAQVSWGIGIQFGTPPPEREVIVERPYSDGIWVPGYYNSVGYSREWVPGFWRHPHGWAAPERRYGYGYERGREFAGRERGGDRARGDFRREGRRQDDRRDGGRGNRGDGGRSR
jgi:hypothetical protein